LQSFGLLRGIAQTSGAFFKQSRACGSASTCPDTVRMAY
jgi:hypothetical protein